MNKQIAASILALAALAAGPTTSAMPIIVDGGDLQDIFDSIDLDGLDPTDTDDQFQNGGEWAVSGSGGSVGRVISDGDDPDALVDPQSVVAGPISFGLYEIGRPRGERVELFNAGSSGPGSFLTFSLDEEFNVSVNGELTGLTLPDNKFGFYITDGVNTWFSEYKRNPNMDAHVVVFQGNGEVIDLPGAPPGNFSAGEYILAWELSPLSAGERRYDDFVVFVESIDELPEPGTLTLLGLGLLGLGGAARRRR